MSDPKVPLPDLDASTDVVPRAGDKGLSGRHLAAAHSFACNGSVANPIERRTLHPVSPP